MRSAGLLFFALILLMVGCSRPEPAPAAPVSVPAHATPPTESPPAPSAPPPAKPEKRPVALTFDAARNRVRGVPEVIQECARLGTNCIIVQMNDRVDSYQFAVGAKGGSQDLFSLHLRVNMYDGTVYLSDDSGKEHKVEPIVVTKESALQRVADLEAVKAYHQRVGARYTQEIRDVDSYYFGIRIGEQTDQGARWALRYQVDKGDQGILQEVDLAPVVHLPSHPVTEAEALALVEAVPAAQAIRTKHGKVYSTDVGHKGEDQWLVMLGTAQEGLGWRPTDFFYVERATGRVWNLQRIAY